MDRATRTLDRKPGSLPEIQTTDNGIAFVMAPFGANGQRLVVRCDENGNVWVAIRRENARDAG
jgi:hypothetical protein